MSEPDSPGARSPVPSPGAAIRGRGARWLERIGRSVSTRDFHGLRDVVTGGVRHRLRRAAPVEGAMFRYGRYIHRGRPGEPGRRAVHRFTLPVDVERVGATGFVVDLEKVTTYCGFSFAPGGWHPFLELIREYEHDPSLRYEDSVLCRLYERFTPATLQQAMFVEDTALAPLDLLPADRHLLRSLWALDARLVDRLVTQAPHAPKIDGESRYFGPKTHAAGAWHFRKVIDLHVSMQRHGYDPVRFGGERPRGYFLVRGGDYRFVIGHANRRLAGIHAAGVRRLVATFFEHVPPVVDEACLDRWSTDNGGVFPQAVAERLFDRLFTATGTERADALGLR